VPANTDVFLRGSNMSTWEKQILSRAVGILKENGVTTHFPEIIELKFGKKMPYIVMYFKAFYNYGCLSISQQYVVTHSFLFGFQYPLLGTAFTYNHKLSKHLSY